MAAAPAPRRRLVTALWLSVAVALCVGLVALGNWQLDRRVLKLGLIERVTARVGAAAVAAPLPADWPAINRDDDEYRHIRLRGEFVAGMSQRVQAVTELGSGYWVLSPLRSAQAGMVMVNRGFIAQGEPVPVVPSGSVELTGLLRLSEPDGAFLRDNLPGQRRWYSRDIAAMAEVLELPLAPYFIDAKTQETGGDAPVAGLTVISFHNSHMVYALTWYALALMVLGAAALLYRENRRPR